MSRFLWGSLSAAIAVFTVSLATPAQAAVVSNVKQPVSAFTRNPCNDEFVHIDVTEHMMMTDTSTPSGNESFDVVDNFHGTGVGDQGNSYEVSQTLRVTFNFHPDGSAETPQQNFTSPSNFHLISKTAPSFTSHFLFHLTIDANGDTTSFIDNFTNECR
jgi:hypothetical protein